MEQPGLIHTQFEIRARQRPDALALSADGRRISYGQLDRASAALAGRIQTEGPGPGEVVAILAERGPETVAAVLACSRAGRPFVVFDLAYPPDRLAQLSRICRPTLAILAGAAAAEAAQRLGLASMAVDLEAAGAPPDLAISPDAPAYLLFTSGSTGAPKCLACSHRPLVHFVDWQARTFELCDGDRFTLLSGLSHDPVLRDIFAPLSLGASLHIPAQQTLIAPGALHAWFAAERVTTAHMTPPLGRLLTGVREGAERLADLRRVFWGGDVLRYQLVDALGALAPDAESVNFYGSTETPQAISYFRTRPGRGEGCVPIGTAVEGFAIEIRSEAGRPGFTAQGELVVRSKLLTLGEVLHGRVPASNGGGREAVYATGDIGSRRRDGEIMIHGRLDDQVKVRGYRVELLEVTAAVLTNPGVAQAITLNVGPPEAARLCAFVQPSDEADTVDQAALRAQLESRLPPYAVPDEIVVMARLPLLPNGKIDRQALVAGQTGVGAAASEIEPAGASHTGLLEDWRKIFPGRPVTAQSSFASLAGDSLSYVTAYLSVERELGCAPDGWTALTIAELGALAASGQRKARGPMVEVETAILLRAVAICAVVASHFQIIATGTAATSALIWVSGALFGRLQLQEVKRGAGAWPVVRLLKSLLLPLLVIEGPQVLVKFLTHYHARLSSVFLYVDLLDYRRFPASGPEAYGGHEYLMWYVHCLLHILIIFAVLIFVCSRVLKLKRPMEATLAAAVALGLLGRFILPAALEPGFLTAPVDPLSIFNHSPATYLGVFALGACGAVSAGRTRLALFALALVYAALGARTYGLGDSLSIAVAAGLLTFLPKLQLPRLLARPLYMTAGASFFIYLLHFKVLAVAGRFPALPMPAVAILAVAFGVAAWGAWTFGLQRLQSIWPRLRAGLHRLAADIRRPWSSAPAGAGGAA